MFLSLEMKFYQSLHVCLFLDFNAFMTGQIHSERSPSWGGFYLGFNFRKAKKGHETCLFGRGGMTAKSCSPTGYNVSYSDDKQYGTDAHHISSEAENIMTEIMTNGPVEGAFTVYADFPSYKSGKYSSVRQLCVFSGIAFVKMHPPATNQVDWHRFFSQCVCLS